MSTELLHELLQNRPCVTLVNSTVLLCNKASAPTGFRAVLQDVESRVSVITVSSSFGSGGSVVATQVAENLGWRLINRAIPAEVAEQLSVPIDVALSNDEDVGGKFWRAMVRSVMQLAVDVGSNLPREILTGEEAFRTTTETIIKRVAASSDCVVVGRAAAVILQGHNDALHVRLDGPAEARVQQAMSALNLAEGEARRKLQQTDRARVEYLKLFYQRDWADPSLYHLMIDSTAIPLAACAEIIVAAAKSRMLMDRQRGDQTELSAAD